MKSIHIASQTISTKQSIRHSTNLTLVSPSGILAQAPYNSISPDSFANGNFETYFTQSWKSFIILDRRLALRGVNEKCKHSGFWVSDKPQPRFFMKLWIVLTEYTRCRNPIAQIFGLPHTMKSNLRSYSAIVTVAKSAKIYLTEPASHSQYTHSRPSSSSRSKPRQCWPQIYCQQFRTSRTIHQASKLSQSTAPCGTFHSNTATPKLP